MRGRLWIAAVFLTGAFNLPASAQVKLERKITEGSTRTIVTSTVVEQKMTVNGMQQGMSNESKTTVTVSVGKRDAAGQVRVQEKVEALQVHLKAGGFKYDFDSADPDKTGNSPLEQMRPINKSAVGRVSTTVFDKNNAITAVELDSSVLKDLPQEARAAFESNQEKFKDVANDDLKQIPSEPIKKGDSWERKSKTIIGQNETLAITTRYVYEGEVEKQGRKLDRISTTIFAVSYSIDGLPMVSVKSSDLKPTESKGEILFDRQLGQPVEMSSSIRISGELVFSASGMEVPAKIELKMDSSMQPKT